MSECTNQARCDESLAERCLLWTSPYHQNRLTLIHINPGYLGNLMWKDCFCKPTCLRLASQLDSIQHLPVDGRKGFALPSCKEFSVDMGKMTLGACMSECDQDEACTSFVWLGLKKASENTSHLWQRDTLYHALIGLLIIVCRLLEAVDSP